MGAPTQGSGSVTPWSPDGSKPSLPINLPNEGTPWNFNSLITIFALLINWIGAIDAFTSGSGDDQLGSEASGHDGAGLVGCEPFTATGGIAWAAQTLRTRIETILDYIAPLVGSGNDTLVSEATGHDGAGLVGCEAYTSPGAVAWAAATLRTRLESICAALDVLVGTGNNTLGSQATGADGAGLVGCEAYTPSGGIEWGAQTLRARLETILSVLVKLIGTGDNTLVSQATGADGAGLIGIEAYTTSPGGVAWAAATLRTRIEAILNKLDTLAGKAATNAFTGANSFSEPIAANGGVATLGADFSLVFSPGSNTPSLGGTVDWLLADPEGSSYVITLDPAKGAPGVNYRFSALSITSGAWHFRDLGSGTDIASLQTPGGPSDVTFQVYMGNWYAINASSSATIP